MAWLKTALRRCEVENMVLEVWSPARSISMTWEVVGNTDYQAPAQAYWIRVSFWRWNPAICVLTSLGRYPQHWFYHWFSGRILACHMGGPGSIPTQWFVTFCRLPWRLRSKESTCQCRRHGFDPWVRKSPWRRKWAHTLVFLPGKWSHGQRSLGCYCSWDHPRVGHDLATKQQQEFRITVPNDTVREAELSISLKWRAGLRARGSYGPSGWEASFHLEVWTGLFGTTFCYFLWAADQASWSREGVILGIAEWQLWCKAEAQHVRAAQQPWLGDTFAGRRGEPHGQGSARHFSAEGNPLLWEGVGWGSWKSTSADVTELNRRYTQLNTGRLTTWACFFPEKG